MISRKDRHRRASQRRKRKLVRLAMHLVAMGLSVLLLGAGLAVIWHYSPDRAWHSGNGHAVDADGNAGSEAVPGAETGREASGGTGGTDSIGQADGTGEDGFEPDDPWLGTEDEPSVRLLMVGDIMMGGRIAGLLEREGYDYPYRHVGDAIRQADLAMGNLENPITSRGEPADKTWTFRTDPLAVPALKESGFDVLSLANNHTLDYGVTGLLDTLDALDEQGIGRVGAGRDADEAYRPYFAEVNGIRIACLGFSHVVPEVGWKAAAGRPGVAEAYDIRRAVDAIGKAKDEADLVVVMVHWGIERAEEPEPYQVNKAHAFIDAGADLVIGSHPHVLQGLESYKGKWIAYSLGNFIFTVNASAETRQSAMLQADCGPDGNCRLSVIPVETGPGQPFYPDEDGAQAILDRLNRLSYQARVNDDGSVERDPEGRVYEPPQRVKRTPDASGPATEEAETPAAETGANRKPAEDGAIRKPPAGDKAGYAPPTADNGPDAQRK